MAIVGHSRLVLITNVIYYVENHSPLKFGVGSRGPVML